MLTDQRIDELLGFLVPLAEKRRVARIIEAEVKAEKCEPVAYLNYANDTVIWPIRRHLYPNYFPVFTTPQPCPRGSELEVAINQATENRGAQWQLDRADTEGKLLSCKLQLASLTQERDEWKNSALNGGNAGYLRQELNRANAVIEKCKEPLQIASLRCVNESETCKVVGAIAAIAEYQNPKGGE